MKSLHFHSTLKYKEHNKMVVTKNKHMEQQRNVDKAKDYIMEHTSSVLEQIRAIKARLNNGELQEGEPIVTMGRDVVKHYATMIDKLIDINADTTITYDEARGKSQKILDDGISSTLAVIEGGFGEVERQTAKASSELFSRGVDESPRTLAMLGNDTLLADMRKDFTKFTNDKTTASVLNTFNMYGLMSEGLKDTIINSVNQQHSPEAVAYIDKLEVQREHIEFMQGNVKTAHRMLTTDTGKIVASRVLNHDVSEME